MRIIGFRLFLIFLILNQILIVYFLSVKIRNISKRQVKGTYVTILNKNFFIFDKSSVFKYFYEPKPDTVILNTPEWLGKEIKNSITSDSLNERLIYNIDKKIDTYRIITIGDSFTYGQFVNTSENFSEILEDALNFNIKCKNISKFEVINLGVGGYDIDYTIERFKKRGLKYNPNLVIWLLEDWNFKRIRELEIPIENQFVHSDIPIVNPTTAIHEVAVKTSQVINKKYGYDQVINFNTGILNKFPNIYKGSLLIIGFPSTPEKFKNIIKTFVNQNNKYSYFSNITDVPLIEDYKLLDGHPNKLGHQKVADDIFKYLFEYLNKNLNDCTEK